MDQERHHQRRQIFGWGIISPPPLTKNSPILAVNKVSSNIMYVVDERDIVREKESKRDRQTGGGEKQREREKYIKEKRRCSYSEI